MTRKISKKAIKAEVIKEVAKQYKDNYGQEIERLKSTLGKFNQENKELRNENAKLKFENSQLTDKLNQYEDWIARLQEWCNLPDDEKDKAIKEFKVSQEANSRLNDLMKMVYPYSQMLFR